MTGLEHPQCGRIKLVHVNFNLLLICVAKLGHALLDGLKLSFFQEAFQLPRSASFILLVTSIGFPFDAVLTDVVLLRYAIKGQSSRLAADIVGAATLTRCGFFCAGWFRIFCVRPNAAGV
jgi:hypothetical protein